MHPNIEEREKALERALTEDVVHMRRDRLVGELVLVIRILATRLIAERKGNVEDWLPLAKDTMIEAKERWAKGHPESVTTLDDADDMTAPI